MARWHINFKRIFNLSPSMTMTNDAAESVGMFGKTLRCLTGEGGAGQMQQWREQWQQFIIYAVP